MFLTRLTSSPQFYTILYISICVLAAFNIFEIVFLLVHKFLLERSEAKKELLKHRITTAIVTVTDPDEVLPKPSGSTEFDAYSEAAASIIESFEGEIAERAAGLTYKFEIDLYFKRLARNAVWYKRAHAIDILSSLKLKKSREFFSAVFKNETSDAVRYRIIYGLSLLVRGLDDIHPLSKMVSALPYLTAKYTEDIFLNVIAALKTLGKEEEFGSFLKQIMTATGISAAVKRDCLSACHASGCDVSADIIMEYYKAFKTEPEIVIVCIKTLARIGDFTILPEVLNHADWRVRLTALKYAHLCSPDIDPDNRTLLHDPDYHFAVLPDILRQNDWQARLTALKTAHLGNTEVLRLLRTLLHDHNYHIRLNAALALSRIGALGTEVLRDEMTSPDKYASEAARYAIGDWRVS